MWTALATQYLGHDVVHIILDDAAAQFLAGETAFAELNILAHEGNLLNVVSGGLSPFHELVSEHVAV